MKITNSLALTILKSKYFDVDEIIDQHRKKYIQTWEISFLEHLGSFFPVTFPIIIQLVPV